MEGANLSGCRCGSFLSRKYISVDGLFQSLPQLSICFTLLIDHSIHTRQLVLTNLTSIQHKVESEVEIHSKA